MPLLAMHVKPGSAPFFPLSLLQVSAFTSGVSVFLGYLTLFAMTQSYATLAAALGPPGLYAAYGGVREGNATL